MCLCHFVSVDKQIVFRFKTAILTITTKTNLQMPEFMVSRAARGKQNHA